MGSDVATHFALRSYGNPVLSVDSRSANFTWYRKTLLLVASIFLLVALFTWVFWYRLALKKYKTGYKEEIEIFEKSKISIFLDSRAFKVLLYLMILVAAGIGWYIGDRIFG